MVIDLALVSFVLIAIFTPGPSNVSSASMGILYGYRLTVTYLIGLATGAFLMFTLSGVLAGAFLSLIPTLEPILRVIGASYILYLAYMILRASYHFDGEDAPPVGLTQGILLQVLNPKLIVFGLTLFSTMLTPITDNLLLVIVAALLLTAITFCATSVWALFGSLLKHYLRQPRVALVVNLVLALFLVYSAAEIVGII